MKSDEQIQQDVMDELKWQPFLKASEIGVAVKNGIVTLSGTVNSYSKKIAAENAAKSIKGVKAVAEDIQVLVRPDNSKSDADLASAVLNAIKWHSIAQEDKVQVKVEDGWVTLSGHADYEFQKTAAENAVENLLGVKGVVNNIIVVPQIETKDVKREIALAFHRSATLDSGNITIETQGDKVVLKGKVRSFAEKRDAAKAAWRAPGVRAVENKLEIASEVYATME